MSSFGIPFSIVITVGGVPEAGLAFAFAAPVLGIAILLSNNLLLSAGAETRIGQQALKSQPPMKIVHGRAVLQALLRKLESSLALAKDFVGFGNIGEDGWILWRKC